MNHNQPIYVYSDSPPTEPGLIEKLLVWLFVLGFSLFALMHWMAAVIADPFNRPMEAGVVALFLCVSAVCCFIILRRVYRVAKNVTVRLGRLCVVFYKVLCLSRGQ